MRQLKIARSVTNREALSLDKYLQDIGKEEMVSVEEEVRLTQRIRAGDQWALEKLCKANLRFVVSVAKQYQGHGLSLPDLINEGNLGLIKAAQRFDETRGFKFISYAVWWIRQSILFALAEQGRIVKLPLNRITELNKVNKCSERLEKEYEREPIPSEVADEMEISEEKVKGVLRIRRQHSISIDAPTNEEDQGSNWLDINEDKDAVQPDEGIIKKDLAQEIERCLATLSFYKDGDRDINIVRLYFGLGGISPRTLEEIGEIYDITRERVRQIIAREIRRLKYSKKTKFLKIYLV